MVTCPLNGTASITLNYATHLLAHSLATSEICLNNLVLTGSIKHLVSRSATFLSVAIFTALNWETCFSSSTQSHLLSNMPPNLDDAQVLCFKKAYTCSIIHIYTQGSTAIPTHFLMYPCHFISILTCFRQGIYFSLG